MLFEAIRKLSCPFEKIEIYVPKEGKILDVGCGHGIFSRILAKASSRRQVLGIDPSHQKIRIARQKSKGLPNLKFKRAYLEDVNGKFDCVCIIDVLYLLPKRGKLTILREAKNLLEKNGKLVLKETDKKPWLLYQLLRIQETLMVLFLKFTHSDYQGLFFEDKKNLRKLLNQAGFKIELEKNLRATLPYPHILFVARVEE